MRRVAIALVHWPVLDGRGEIVTSAITNLDVHDLARSARTFGVSDYFIVHPITAQRELVEKIRVHWAEGSSGKRIPTRKDALALLRPVASLADAHAALGGREAIEVWTTSAAEDARVLTMADARARCSREDKPLLIVFGTAWGLAAEVHASADARLAPIQGPGAWNHLSVRSACAIYLDRLFGQT
ncbi:MAG TPA: RNA methyltransferase [Polyangiaceae bacterium]|jgi:hypothetical protein